MIQDLKADSANFERSGDRGSPPSDGFGHTSSHSPNFILGAYENSMVHRSRQHWGPTGESQSSSTPVSSRDSEHSRDSRDSRTTASSIGYPAQYSNDGAASHSGYDAAGYDRRPDPRLIPQAHQRGDYGDPQDSYAGYPPQSQSAYGQRSESIPQYTHQPSIHGQPQGGPAYGYPPENDFGRAVQPGYQDTAAPRSQTQYTNPATASHPGYGSSHPGVTTRYFGPCNPEYLVYN